MDRNDRDGPFRAIFQYQICAKSRRFQSRVRFRAIFEPFEYRI